MKKVMLITVLAVGSIALAASLNVPWFADNAAAHTGGNPSTGIMCLVALHNNLGEDITCGIAYYAADGTPVDGVDTTDRLYVLADDYNTFVITANATVQFRPVADDPSPAADIHPNSSLTKGQESNSGVVVPNRPMYTVAEGQPGYGFTEKENGALVVTWVIDPVEGTPNAASVQGRVESGNANKGWAQFLLPGGS